MNEKFCILSRILLKIVCKCPIDNNPALVQIMGWRRTGDKRMHGCVRNDSESNTSRVRFSIIPHTPMRSRFITHILCVNGIEMAFLGVNLIYFPLHIFQIRNLLHCLDESWWNMSFKETRLLVTVWRTMLLFKGLRPVLEGFVVTMHDGACETGSQIPRALARGIWRTVRTSPSAL